MTKHMTLPNFLWKVENFTSVEKKVSPAKLIGGLKWQLTFSQFMEDGDERIRLDLDCLNSSEALSSFEIIAEVSSVDFDGSTNFLKEARYSLKYKDLCLWSDTISSFCSDYDEKDAIIFLVKITPAGRPETSFKNQESICETESQSLCLQSLTEDFGRLFNTDENSDFVLNCGEKHFHVHKAVLSARSSFFAGMFRSKMKEANGGSAKIENIQPDILELVLRYLYTGGISNLSTEILHKVYAAADRFALESLKIRCSSLFTSNLIHASENGSNETYPEVDDEEEATVSTKEKEEKLLKELFMTREWRIFTEEFPDKCQEMCRIFLLQQS